MALSTETVIKSAADRLTQCKMKGSGPADSANSRNRERPVPHLLL
jgi:hypothetical protein